MISVNHVDVQVNLQFHCNVLLCTHSSVDLTLTIMSR